MIEYEFKIYHGAQMKILTVKGMKTVVIQEPENNTINFTKEGGEYVIFARVKQSNECYSTFYIRARTPFILEEHPNDTRVILKDMQSNSNIILNFVHIKEKEWAKNMILRQLHALGFVK